MGRVSEGFLRFFRSWRNLLEVVRVAGLALMIRATRGRSRRPNHMPSQIGGPKGMSPVALRRLAGGFHSVAKQASFYIALQGVFTGFWRILGGFWRPKWRSKSILERFFSMFLFECVLASILGGFLEVFWRVEPLKIVLPSRRNANSHKIDVFRKSSKKVRKNLDFGVDFGCQNHEKSRKNGVENHVFF